MLIFQRRQWEPHSSTLAWKIPWMEEPGRLQSMGSQRVGHDWATSLSLFTFMHWRRKWQPTPVFLPGESLGWGSLVSCRRTGCRRTGTWGRTESDTLKRLSSSSSRGFTWPPYLKSHPPCLPNLSSCSAIFPIALSPPNTWNLCFMISVLFVSFTLLGYKLLERRVFFSIHWWFPKIYSSTWDMVDSW